jgi:riboflavin synthase
MFTGIIETTGKINGIQNEGNNVRLTVECSFTGELKVDQSVAHNGVCLTVVSLKENTYDVIAIDETLRRTNLGSLKIGDEVNLERSLKAGDRLDGHIVQGHVDTTARVTQIIPQEGSWIIHFTYDDPKYITVEKGSVCVNGISLTVVDSGRNTFSVAIIPYTWEHTNLHLLSTGSTVNVEFDILGKYISKLHGVKTA